MNIQVTAKTFSSTAALLADYAAVRRRLFTPAKSKALEGLPELHCDPLVTVKRRLPREKLHFHDAHVKAFRRWQMVATNGPCTAHILSRCAEERIPYESVMGPCRTRKIAEFRQLLMWEIKTSVKPSATYPELGRLFGGRDHTTALHAIRKMEARHG